MAVYKDGDKWRVIYRYTNYKGERKQTQKRGFATKREAQAWEREVMLKSESKLDMTFASFFEIYEADKKKRVKENTWESKSHIIRTKILPYFGERKIAEIEPKDVIAWQNELLAYKGENGEVYSTTYLKTIHSQFSAIFNHAVRYYHLPSNPAQRAGTMGSEEHKEMLFWTKEEYLKFADVMMDKPVSYYAFEMLYVKEFLNEYRASKAEYSDYQLAVSKWEQQIGNKAESDSIRSRLQQKQQEVKERENNRQSHYYMNDRGGR